MKQMENQQQNISQQDINPLSISQISICNTINIPEKILQENSQVKKKRLLTAKSTYKTKRLNNKVQLDEEKLDRSHPQFKQKLRQKFIGKIISYQGIPYKKKWFEPNEELYNSPIFLDCCGLIRQAIYDLREYFGFELGGGNQAYQFDTLPITLRLDQLQPGDLIFYSGRYFDKEKRRFAHDMVHVEMYYGSPSNTWQSVGARWRKGVVQTFESFKFTSKTYFNVVHYYKSIDTWLDGVCKSFCPIHPWKGYRAKRYNVADEQFQCLQRISTMSTADQQQQQSQQLQLTQQENDGSPNRCLSQLQMTQMKEISENQNQTIPINQSIGLFKNAAHQSMGYFEQNSSIQNEALVRSIKEALQNNNSSQPRFIRNNQIQNSNQIQNFNQGRPQPWLIKQQNNSISRQTKKLTVFLDLENAIIRKFFTKKGYIIQSIAQINDEYSNQNKNQNPIQFLINNNECEQYNGTIGTQSQNEVKNMVGFSKLDSRDLKNTNLDNKLVKSGFALPKLYADFEQLHINFLQNVQNDQSLQKSTWEIYKHYNGRKKEMKKKFIASDVQLLIQDLLFLNTTSSISNQNKNTSSQLQAYTKFYLAQQYQNTIALMNKPANNLNNDVVKMTSRNSRLSSAKLTQQQALQMQIQMPEMNQQCQPTQQQILSRALSVINTRNSSSQLQELTRIKQRVNMILPCIQIKDNSNQKANANLNPNIETNNVNNYDNTIFNRRKQLKSGRQNQNLRRIQQFPQFHSENAIGKCSCDNNKSIQDRYKKFILKILNYLQNKRLIILQKCLDKPLVLNENPIEYGVYLLIAKQKQDYVECFYQEQGFVFGNQIKLIGQACILSLKSKIKRNENNNQMNNMKLCETDLDSLPVLLKTQIQEKVVRVLKEIVKYELELLEQNNQAQQKIIQHSIQQIQVFQLHSVRFKIDSKFDIFVSSIHPIQIDKGKPNHETKDHHLGQQTLVIMQALNILLNLCLKRQTDLTGNFIKFGLNDVT